MRRRPPAAAAATARPPSLIAAHLSVPLPPHPCTQALQVVLEPLDGPNEGIFFLSLTRPEARNAIGRAFLRELRECLHTVAQERTTRCVVVRSTVPGVFCAGADLKVRSWALRGGMGRSACSGGGILPLLLFLLPLRFALLITPLRAQERAGMSQAEASTFVRELREAFAQLDALPMPTVACVDGWVGGWADWQGTRGKPGK